MLTTSKTTLPELMSKQLRHSDVNKQNEINEENANELDSDCDVSSDSSTSQKSMTFQDKPQFSKVTSVEDYDALNTWKNQIMRQTQIDNDFSGKKADFSIQSLLSSNHLNADSLYPGDNADFSRSTDPSKNPHRSQLREAFVKQCVSTSQPEKAEVASARLADFFQIQQSLHALNGSAINPHNQQSRNFPHPNAAASHSPSSPKELDSVKEPLKPILPQLPELPTGLTAGQFPGFPSLQPTPQMSIHSSRTPFNFPSMMPRFSTAPFGLHPFRSQFNPATLSFPWLQNETFLRNLTDLAGN